MLKTNNTLTLLDLSGNEIGGYFAGKDRQGTPNDWKSTPEGPAALADGLKANTGVQQLDASGNAMGSAGAKAFGDTLLVNKTIQTLDVSDNSFGKLQEGEQVKLKSSGEMKVVTANNVSNYSDNPTTYNNIKVQGSDSKIKPSEFEWESQVPALCAGVAASPSLISVSTIFRHALAVIFLTHPLISTMYVARCFCQRPWPRGCKGSRCFYR